MLGGFANGGFAWRVRRLRCHKRRGHLRSGRLSLPPPGVAVAGAYPKPPPPGVAASSGGREVEFRQERDPDRRIKRLRTPSEHSSITSDEDRQACPPKFRASAGDRVLSLRC